MNAGIEYWQPLFFEEMASLFDYLPKNSLFITFDGLQEKAEQFRQDAQKRFENRIDPMRPLLEPNKLWFSLEEINRLLKGYPHLTLTPEKVRKSAAKSNLNVAKLPDLAINPHLKNPFDNFEQFRKKFNGNIIFSVETEGRRETLLDLLVPLKLKPKQIKTLNEIKEPISLLISALDQGFVIENAEETSGENLAIICETDLLGERVHQPKSADKRKTVNPDTLIRNLAELKIGQAVVHLENGVGRYAG